MRATELSGRHVLHQLSAARKCGRDEEEGGHHEASHFRHGIGSGPPRRHVGPRESEFIGAWKLRKADPAGYKGPKGPTLSPRTGSRVGRNFADALAIKQSANEITITSTSFGDNQQRTLTYTLDNKEGERRSEASWN